MAALPETSASVSTITNADASRRAEFSAGFRRHIFRLFCNTESRCIAYVFPTSISLSLLKMKVTRKASINKESSLSPLYWREKTLRKSEKFQISTGISNCTFIYRILTFNFTMILPSTVTLKYTPPPKFRYFKNKTKMCSYIMFCLKTRVTTQILNQYLCIIKCACMQLFYFG